MAARKSAKRNPDTLLKEVRVCNALGYFQGAIERINRLKSQKSHLEKVPYLEWVSRFHLGPSQWHSACSIDGMKEMCRRLSGGWMFIEHLAMDSYLNACSLESAVNGTLRFAERQNGALNTLQPTGLLFLAERCLDSGLIEKAISLVSLLLSLPVFYLRLEDVNRLGIIMLKMNAPHALWADWSLIFFEHCFIANARRAIFQEQLPASDRAHKWARTEDENSEFVLRYFLSNGPKDLKTLFCRLADQTIHPTLSSIVETSFQEGCLQFVPCKDATWWEESLMRFRYQWFDMLETSEKAILRNGDWALFACPTNDFSMGTAQWWRVVESVLKRILIESLVRNIPDLEKLADEDDAILNEKQKKSDSVFIEKFARPDQRAKMTLGDVLLILEKCAFGNAAPKTKASKVRQECARLLAANKNIFAGILDGHPTMPSPLSRSNIQWFRNRASHSDTLTFTEGAAGREMALRLLRFAFQPYLNRSGFECSLKRLAIPPEDL